MRNTPPSNFPTRLPSLGTAREPQDEERRLGRWAERLQQEREQLSRWRTLLCVASAFVVGAYLLLPIVGHVLYIQHQQMLQRDLAEFTERLHR